MNFDIFYFINNNKFLILLLIGVGIIYFVLNIIFGNGKHDLDEEENPEELIEKENKKHKIQTGFKKQSSSYMSEARKYDFVPKDGSSVRFNDYNKKKVYKSKSKYNELDIRQKEYEKAFYEKQIPDLNGVAKFMKLQNDSVIDDLKAYKKKQMFLDVNADLVTGKMTYTNNILDRSEEVFYVEETLEENNDENFLNGMKQHKCPNCGTSNIIDAKTKKYNCYYCLQEVHIK